MGILRIPNAPVVPGYSWEAELVEERQNTDTWKLTLMPDQEGLIFEERYEVRYYNWKDQTRTTMNNLVKKKEFSEARQRIKSGATIQRDTRRDEMY